MRHLRLAALGLALWPATMSAQTPDVIRGRVTETGGKAIQGVNVRATSYSGGVARTARTDANGAYTIVFANGEGDYWLDFRAIGYLPRRFEIKRLADEQILLGDARLESSIATLDAVNVSANAPRATPARSDKNNDVSGTDRALSTSELAPDVAGNLAAAAALQPGMQLIPGLDGAPDAFSALGISPDQNTTTFNGIAGSLNALPRDALTSAQVRTFNYDPAIGGFGGAQIAVSTRPGTNFATRLVSGLGRGPASEVTTELAEQQGAKHSVLSLGGNAAGPFVLDRAFYSGAYQLDRDTRPYRTMLNSTDYALSGSGVAADSVRRLLEILAQSGLSNGNGGFPRSQTTDRLALQGNVDLSSDASGLGHAYTIAGTTNLTRTTNAGSAASTLLSTPDHGLHFSDLSSSVTIRHSSYFGFGILSTSSLGASIASTESAPYSPLPQGTVRIRSRLPDGTSAIRTLNFGGSTLDNERKTAALELQNQSTWYAGNNRHALKVTGSLRYEHFSAVVRNEASGTFAFGSLEDLEARRAESYERVLAPRSIDGRQLIGSASIGDSWRPNSGLQVQYGVRLDANRAFTAPAFNATVLERFGVRNDGAPNGVYASPRLGFQWAYGNAPVIITALQTARPPRAMIQGGIGLFQNVGTTQALLEPVLGNTGLQNANRILQCIGAAAPAADWNLYADPAQIPSACRSGDSTVSAALLPAVTMYDRGYHQPRSVRGNLGWSGPVLGNRFMLSTSLQYQRAFNQPGTIDLNLDTASRFRLESEGGRAVFVNPRAITGTGAVIGLAASRRVEGFGRVNLLRSNLSQESRLATIGMRPVFTSARSNWSLNYTYQDAREQYIDAANASGDPFTRAWSRALLPRRHAVTGTFYYNVLDLIRLTGFVTAFSGAFFTPVVLGDVNDDGSALNDRAFVFDWKTDGDTALAHSLERVVEAAPAPIRRCLTDQRGLIAARGSCRGPWQFNANLNATFNSQKLRLPPRVRLTINVNNPLILADVLAHGDREVRGWGQSLSPDPVLLVVRGIDAAARRFRYEVNERFGSTRPSQGIQRGETYLALNVAIDIGAPRERQLLIQRLNEGRSQPGSKMTAANVKAFSAGTIPNPIALLLQQADSLHLTRQQADSLVSMNRALTQTADSAWGGAALFLAALPERYDEGQANQRYVRARERTIDKLIQLAPAVWSLLRDEQRRVLPQTIRDWLDVTVLRAVRSSSSG